MSLKRMWVNQPSTLQPLHRLHGKNVLADTEGVDVPQRTILIFFLSGDVVSQQAPWASLSDGWQTQTPQKGD